MIVIKTMINRLALLILLSVVARSALADINTIINQDDWVSTQWDGMGTRFSIELYSLNVLNANRLIASAKQEAGRIEQLMSTYQAQSEVSLINKNGYLHPIKVSEELIRVLNKARYYSELTDGAFDITYASVGYLYNLRQKISPSQREVDEAINGIDFRYVQINDKASTVRLKKIGTRIDLGGIAKGYTVDRIAEIMVAGGVKNGIITAGGDSRIIGDKRDRPWMIGIKDPRSDQNKSGDEVAVTLPLSDTAFSTSGDYERFFIKNGEDRKSVV